MARNGFIMALIVVGLIGCGGEPSAPAPTSPAATSPAPAIKGDVPKAMPKPEASPAAPAPAPKPEAKPEPAAKGETLQLEGPKAPKN